MFRRKINIYKYITSHNNNKACIIIKYIIIINCTIIKQIVQNTICVDILKGSNFDVIELDGASNRGIDEIRQINESVQYPPSSVEYKVYIFFLLVSLFRISFIGF